MQQNQQNSSKSVAIITIVVLVASAIYYFYYSGGTTASDSQATLTSIDNSSNSAVGENVLTLLNEIHSLRIDTKFFQTPVYQSLTDFSVAIPPVNVGRANPFSSVGSFSVSASSSKASR